MNRRTLFRILLSGFLAVTALLVSPAARAQDDLPDLDLSADQKARLRAVMEDTRRDFKTLYNRLHQARKELFTQFDSYQMDERRVRTLMRQVNDIQENIMQRHLRTQREVRRIVTPAQFEKLKRFMHPFNDRGNKPRRPPKPN